nr:MAG TPA: zinc-ribbon domain protein [Caudoviricetes sp.]
MDVKTKKCKDCGKVFPKTTEYFAYRFQYSPTEPTFLARCKNCQANYNRLAKRRQRARDEKQGVSRKFK